MTPSKYRKRYKQTILSYGDLADRTVTTRFLHDHPDFRAVDAEEAIDYLLEKDAKRFAYRTTSIRAMGFGVVSPNGDLTKGMICIGDDRQGGYWLEFVTDDTDTLCDWIKRFDAVDLFDSTLSQEAVTAVLQSRGIHRNLSATPECLYFGEPLPCDLPQGISVRALSYADKEAILHFSSGNLTPYIKHLLHEQDYNDPSTMEYGVFRESELIVVMGGGIRDVRGQRLNDCFKFYTGEAPLSDVLYRAAYTAATNDLLTRGILPFDNLQHGTYAKEHGNFTTADLGFETVNIRYNIM